MPVKPIFLLSLLALFSHGVQAEDPVKAHLNEELITATLRHEETFERCEAFADEAGSITLPVSELAKRKVTVQELHFAIVYFRDKAQEECSSISRSKLISAILNSCIYSAASPNTPIDPERSGLSLLLPSQNLLEARAMYVRLEPEKTELLDSIFKGSYPSLGKISNWQEAANLLQKD